jgi:hypothetical protein
MAYNIAPAYLKASNNLSDLPNKATARINLGVAIGTDVEAWSAQLDSAAAIASNGFVSRSAVNTFTPRTFQAGSNKVTISNPTGAAGNPAFDVVPANFFALSQWTPTIQGSTTGGTATYGVQAGRYINIGNLWIAVCQLVWSSGTGSGNLRVGNFPSQFAQGMTVYSAHPSYANLLLPGNSVDITVDGVNAQIYANVMASISNAAQLPVAYSTSGTLNFTMIWFS